MKKITSILFVLVVTSHLAACGITDAPQSTQSTTGLTAPSSHITEPSTEGTEHPTEITELDTAPTIPSTEITKPDTEPTAPSAESTEPDTEVTVPSTEITEPDTEPTVPSTEITEPGTEATEPSAEPTIHIHNYTATKTAPGCETEGYTTYRCDCGDTYIDNRVSAVGHSWGKWKTTLAPTEDATGIAERICGLCAARESKTLDKIIPEHTHSYSGSITTAASCETEGTMTYTCSCGDSYTERIAKLGHDYKSIVTEPTCKEEGYTNYTCDRCGDSYQGEITPAAGHCLGDWITVREPTVSAAGSALRRCSVCGLTETKLLDPLIDTHTHQYTDAVTREPTCAAEGERIYTCSCGDFYTEPIDTIPHSYVDKVYEPSCNARGWTDHICSICGHRYTTDWKEPDPDDHDYQLHSVSEPTCTCSGEEIYACTRCGKRYEVDLPMVDHEWGEWVVIEEPYRGVPNSDEELEGTWYINPHDGWAEMHCENCWEYQGKTLEFEDYFPRLDQKSQYMYEFYYIDDLGTDMYTGDTKTIFVKTDNPDPNSVWFWADGMRVSQGNGFEDVEYLADYRFTTGMELVNGGFLTSIMAPDEAGTYSIELQEWTENGYICVQTLQLNVLDMQEQYDNWFNEVIATQTNDSMNPKEKMDAIVKFVTNGQFRYYNTNGERYLNLAASPNSPDFASKRWNSYISPNRLCRFAQMIGGFEEIHNCYGDYAPGTPEWMQIHAFIYVVYEGQKYHYMACPSTDTGYIETIQMIDFSNTSQFTRIG